MKFKYLALAACLYFTVSTSCFASVSQLKHVRQRLELANGESVVERAVEVLKYGVAPLFVNVVCTVVGVMKVARMDAVGDWSPMPYLMVPHPLGFWSDYMAVVRQARDLGEVPQDAISRLNYGVFVAAPFLPIIAIYRIINRERELEYKARILES